MAVALMQRAPQPAANEDHQQRYRQQEIEIRQAEPAGSNRRVRQRSPQADDGKHRQQGTQQLPRCAAHSLLQRTFTFHHQPGGAEQRIGHAQSESAEQAERGQPVKHAATEGATADGETVDHRPDHHALAEGCQQGAAKKGAIPEWPVRRRGLEAKLKGDAAKNQADQHQGQGDRQGVDDHRVGEGKGAKQAGAAEHQPGFIAIPYRRDAVDHYVAIPAAPHRAEQQADAQIKAIHDDVHQRGKDDNHEPDHR